MNVETIIEVAKVAVAIIFGGFALYFKSKVKLTEKVTSLIAQAEDTYKGWRKAGGEKMEWVVAHLYVYVPAWLRPIITPKVLEKIVQFVFDSVESYAKMQLDKVVDKVAK